MEGSEREADAILRMLFYLKHEMIRNSFNEEVDLMNEIISSVERSIRNRRNNMTD